MSYIHLRAHTAYSLLEGAVHPKPLVKKAKEFQQSALGICDTRNLFGAMEFSFACQDQGLQPLFGVSCGVMWEKKNYTLPLYAQSPRGWQNLIKLVSLSYTQEYEDCDRGVLPLQALTPHTEDLLALSGDGLPNLLSLQQTDKAYQYLQTLKTLFPERLYMELSRHTEETPWEDPLINFAYDENVPLIATNQSFFLDPKTYEAHDALICIADGTYVNENNRRRVTPQHHFRSPQDMADLFKDVPEALEQTFVFAQRCHFLLEPIKTLFPCFPTQRGEAEELRVQAEEGLKERLEHHVFKPSMTPEEKTSAAQIYEERLAYEVRVINEMGFPGYFLIVSDFIKWAKAQNIPVGPGRGSGAGSLVAWCLKITDLDPLAFGLLFERFLNPERISMPDFDIDFCQDRRDEVISYVREKYGHDHVAHIITFGKLQARAVLRDVGRVLQMPYAQVDRLCKLIPNNPAAPVTLEEALERDPALQTIKREDQTVDHLMTLACQLEGLYRHASTHAAGVVIGDRPLDQLVPLYYDPRSPLPATQFNMKYVEQAGLIKFDFLGLKTLTVIQKTCDLLKTQGKDVDISTIPFDDPETFALLNRVETVGLFQVESGGMSDVLRRLKPDRLEELIALVALYRPGPMDNIPKYIACRHGEENVTYPYPILEEILKETFGIIVYQEQVLLIAQKLAGYTMGGADILRRAMGKKIQSEMTAQRKVFVEGVLKNYGGPEKKAEDLFDQIVSFASYAFNKSHAAAYALILYQTAYLKANFPVEFMAASMTLDQHNTDKLAVFVKEAKRMGIDILPPDINLSESSFRVEKRGIRYSLSALKNVGENAIESLVEERLQRGPFKDIFDVFERCDSKVLNKRQLESLIASGAFDAIHPNRRSIFENLETLSRYAQQESHQGLFGKSRPPLSSVEEWPLLEKLKREFEAVGFYLSTHPLNPYGPLLEDLRIIDSHEIADFLEEGKNKTIKLGGVIVSVQLRTSKTGSRFAFVMFSDPYGSYEVAVFSEHLARYRELLVPGEMVVLEAAGKKEEEAIRLTLTSLTRLEDALGTLPQSIIMPVHTKDQLNRLHQYLETLPSGPISLILEVAHQHHVQLPTGYQLMAEERMQLRKILYTGK